MGRVECGRSNLICWSDTCKNARTCACNICGQLKALNPNLYDACVDACQQLPRPESADKFLCNTIGPEVLFNRYGVIKCGFDPYDTLEGDLYVKNEEDKKERNDFQTKLIVGLGGVLLILIFVFVWD